jgi:CheY-like chemotaxis protein
VPRPQSILLIEPDDDSRARFAEYLHTFGFTVLTADTTDDGLTRASDADVIVTWMGVPGSCDGVELVRRVRQPDIAWNYMEQALATVQRVSDRSLTAQVLHGKAVAHWYCGEPETALEAGEHALSLV